MAASDAAGGIPVKNQAYRVTFPILDADGDLVVSATGLDSEVSKDGGTFADCTNEATQIATNSGIYYLDLTATEMNADTVAIQVKTSSSGAKTTVIVLYPVSATLTTMATNIAAILTDTDTTIPGLIATVDSVVDAILVDTDATIPGLISTVDTVVDAILADTVVLTDGTLTEPTQGAPAVLPTLSQAIALLYKIAIGKRVTSRTEEALYNNAGTKIMKSTLSTDGAAFTRDKLQTGA